MDAFRIALLFALVYIKYLNRTKARFLSNHFTSILTVIKGAKDLRMQFFFLENCTIYNQTFDLHLQTLV